MAVDYEVEFNNRARVPEHPQIFARWTADARSYREDAERARRAELGVHYGASGRQILDIFASAAGRGPGPVALFVHGGWWRSLDPSSFSHMARGLNAHGLTVAVAGYDLCPQVPVRTIVEEIRAACLFLWRRFGKRIMIYGHSAGGHLAACMVATDWKACAGDAPADLVPAGYAISGVFDLAPVVATSINQDLRLDAEEARLLSPIGWPVTAGRVLDAVVGGAESNEFLRQSQAIADAWRARGAETRYEAVPGANHFTVIEPLADPDSAMVRRLIELSHRAQVLPL